ncbi:MAG: glycosyltransferase [Sphingobacteriales bacterium]|nr:glycosyltransferase [Sphingobacteriales bacterium]
MNLPNLDTYTLRFGAKGIVRPLNIVPALKQGLLDVLPLSPENKTGWCWTEQSDPKIYLNRTSWPKITIVSPSFNQGTFLEETIRSVLLQNYPNLEYIVIDGGSTDESLAILEKYSPWISYWQSEADKGQGQAINLGFSLGSGEYYAWINSDDYYLKNVFNTVINTFLSTEAEFIYGYGYSKNVSDNKLVISKILPLLDYFIKIPGLIQPSTFWKSSIHKPIWEELDCAIDYELWLRLVKGKKRRLIKEPLSVAYIHNLAKTHNLQMKAKWHEDHLRTWALDAHGAVPEWGRIVLLNRIRLKIYRMLKLI